MTEKQFKDPILSRSVMPNKNDILIFKNETLKDFKEVQKKITEKYKDLEFELREKLETYEQRISTYENKIIELSKLINTDKTIREKVDKLMEFKEKADDTMLTEKIRLDNFRNDLNSNVERIDQILKDSVIYPGIVGGISKFKTFHDLIDYVLAQCSQNLTFREKSILDFKGYKTKLENIISSFNTQVNTLLNTTSEYTKTCVKDLEKKIKSIFDVYDDRLQDTRIENANYAIGLERTTEALKKELEKLEVIKKELYNKVDKGILEIKNDNTRVTKLFSGYKKNFHIMQHKFTQLSDFIKDIRFRVNLKEDVNRREYSHMSDLINFDKKKKPGFYNGVYSHDIIKKGLESQLKDYIEGKITAEQLFKKRENKSLGKLNNDNINSNDSNKRKTFTGINKNENNFDEETKLNFFDILKNINKKSSFEIDETKNMKKLNSRREPIKEEDDENNNSSKELNSIFYKTIKEKKINPNLIEKELEKMKEEKALNINKNIDKKDNEIKMKNEETRNKEESKFQIISKDKDEEKEKEKEEVTIDLSDSKNKKPSFKNALSNLFSAKNILDNIKNDKNEISINEQNDKLKNENSKNNDTSNTLIKEQKNGQNKNILQTPLFRPGTGVNIRKNYNNEQNPLKQNKIGSNEISNLKNRIISGKENKKLKSQQTNFISVNIYNPTLDSFGQYIQTINYKITNNNNSNSKKKANSSNQKNNKYILKQNINSPTFKGNSGIRKEEARTIENMFNNLNNYVPKNDINVDETNYLSLQKKK